MNVFNTRELASHFFSGEAEIFSGGAEIPPSGFRSGRTIPFEKISSESP